MSNCEKLMARRDETITRYAFENGLEIIRVRGCYGPRAGWVCVDFRSRDGRRWTVDLKAF